jgi:RNA polymerase sigma-70 factor (ECF subfamily)
VKRQEQAIPWDAIRQPESRISARRVERKPWRDQDELDGALSRATKGHFVEVRGDPELLLALHDQYAKSLLSYVVGMTSDRAGAQDVVQETLLRAWRNPAVLERTSGSGGGWLFTVAKHIVIDQWRSASRNPEVLTDHLPEQPVDDTVQQTLDRQLVQAALQTLSLEHRQALFECYFRGASIAEAADTLGVPPGTVKSRTHYALRALRRAIDGMGGAA